MTTHLREHLLKQHIKPRVLFDNLLKLLQHGVQLLWIRVYMLYRVIEEFVVVSFVLGQPMSSLRVSAPKHASLVPGDLALRGAK